jgi:hypothetical protein
MASSMKHRPARLTERAFGVSVSTVVMHRHHLCMRGTCFATACSHCGADLSVGTIDRRYEAESSCSVAVGAAQTKLVSSAVADSSGSPSGGSSSIAAEIQLDRGGIAPAESVSRDLSPSFGGECPPRT